MTYKPAHLALWAIAAIPLLIGLASLPEGSFGSLPSTLNALGRLTGIAGLSLFLVTAIISFRIPGFDRPFGGLTKLWQTHHKLGAISFLLLLAHPLLLALAAAEVSLDLAVLVLFPDASAVATWVGWGALLAMMIFLAPSFSFFGHPDYQRWKKLHGLSAVALILALLHTYWLARTLPTPWGGVIWIVLTAGALGAMAYCFLFSRRANRYRYRVEAVDFPANNVVEISFLPQGTALRYEPGQFVYLSPLDGALKAGCNEEHPYTISSAPGEERLRIAIKDLGNASRAIQKVALGSEAVVDGPYGNFFPSPSKPIGPELWVAGGVGITPFLSRMRYLATMEEQVDIQLIYCVQDEARAVFAEELRELTARIPGFVFSQHYFYQQGPLNWDYLRYQCPDIAEREVYACGPDPLLDLLHHLVKKGGVPANQFHTEEFNLL